MFKGSLIAFEQTLKAIQDWLESAATTEAEKLNLEAAPFINRYVEMLRERA